MDTNSTGFLAVSSIADGWGLRMQALHGLTVVVDALVVLAVEPWLLLPALPEEAEEPLLAMMSCPPVS